MLRTTCFLAAAVFTGVLLFPQQVEKPRVGKKSLPHVTIGKAVPRPEDVSTIDGMIKAFTRLSPDLQASRASGTVTPPCTFEMFVS
jgi:hypothetical protein